MDMKYRSFGFIPENFKCSIEHSPVTARSKELADWYNSVLDKFNEAYLDKDYNAHAPSYGHYIRTENGKYSPIDCKAVQSMKYRKNDIPWIFADVYDYIRKYELEKYFSTAPELDDFRKVISILSGLGSYLHSKVNGPSSLSFKSPLDWGTLQKIKEGNRSHYSFEFKFTEGFGSYGWSGDPEGVHIGRFNLWWEGGQFVFPVKDDPLCWNSHEGINSGWSRKSHARLHMSGAASRTKRMATLTARYLNESGLPELIKKHILKEEQKVIVAAAPKILDIKEYGLDGFTYSFTEKWRLVRECTPVQKDVERMKKLIETCKSGEGVAAKITDKYKAARRYVAALKIKGLVPNFCAETGSYSGPFACFGNKAIELGVAPELIAEACK